MTVITRIKTPRLVLAPVTEADACDLHQAKLGTWDTLSKVFAWAADPQKPDLEQDKAYCKQSHEAFLTGKDFSMIARAIDTNKLIASIGLHPYGPTAGHFRIGYWVEGNSQGTGYATESANAILRYAFNALSAKSIVICHALTNEKSKRIITKLGFSYEGIRKNSIATATNPSADAHWYIMEDPKNLPPLNVTYE